MLEQEQNQRAAARNRFLAACSLAGAATTAYRSSAGDADSSVYWLDIARLGAPDAPAVLVLCCGLQGEEGFCGSSIFIDWLNREKNRTVPRDIGLIFVHTVLPPGLGIGGAAAPNEMANRDWSDNVLGAAAKRFARYAQSHGLYTDTPAPETDTVNAHTAWLADAFAAVANEAKEHAQAIAMIEFHTSMQPWGTVAVTSPHVAGGAADRRVAAWFGDSASARHNGPAALDSLALGFGDRLRDQPLTAVHVDFGVYATKSILQLDARKTAAQRRADINSLFFPNSETWLGDIRENGSRVIGEALRGLTAELRASVR